MIENDVILGMISARKTLKYIFIRNPYNICLL